MIFDDNTKIRFKKFIKEDITTKCWEWQGTKLPRGYGRFNYKGKFYLAHRFSMMLEGNDVTGFFVCHHCDNPKCVNPLHLFLGTHIDNMKDMISKGRNKNIIKKKYTRQSTGGLKGILNHSAKLTDDIVREIRNKAYVGKSGRYNTGGNIKELSKKYNVSGTTIKHILNGKTWKHVT